MTWLPEILLATAATTCAYLVWYCPRSSSAGWQTEHRCRKCRGAMTFGCMMGNLGTCPMCGNSSGSTVVDCSDHAFRIDRDWWQFWKPATRIYKED